MQNSLVMFTFFYFRRFLQVLSKNQFGILIFPDQSPLSLVAETWCQWLSLLKVLLTAVSTFYSSKSMTYLLEDKYFMYILKNTQIMSRSFSSSKENKANLK